MAGNKKNNKMPPANLDKKTEEYMKKIEDRLSNVKGITDKYPNMKQMNRINKKFAQAYEERSNFAVEMMKAKQNCSELKEKLDGFLTKQNRLMIQLKGGTRRKGRDF